LGFGTFFISILLGVAFSTALLSALAVLIVSCPCALGLATPLAVASGFRDALDHNIIFKTGAVFEESTKADILAFDKTGTLTTGRMQLLDDGNNGQALAYAAMIEQYSSHPVAEAIAHAIDEELYEVQDFRSFNQGVAGTVDGKRVTVGQPEWAVENGHSMTTEQQQNISEARQNGQVPTVVAWQGQVHSILVVGDQIREEAKSFVSNLKEKGKKIAIITGDSKEAAQPLREKLRPDFLYAGAKPESKTEIIRELKESGNVAMVGDGSNDALALAEADLGIAFGDLTAIAAESAQIVIPQDVLHKVSDAFTAMHLTKARIRQNLGWAFIYNIVAIPLAVAGVINPLFAALAMASSSLLVVGNSSRKLKL